MGNGKRTILDKNISNHNCGDLFSCFDCYFLHLAEESSLTTYLQQGISLKYWPDTFKKTTATKRQRDGHCLNSSFESKIQSVTWILRGHALYGILRGIHKDDEFLIRVSKLSRRHSWASDYPSVYWYFKYSCFWCRPCTKTWTYAWSDSCHSQLNDSSQHSLNVLWVFIWVR